MKPTVPFMLAVHVFVCCLYCLHLWGGGRGGREGLSAVRCPCAAEIRTLPLLVWLRPPVLTPPPLARASAFA